jgi:bifunctional enzyme CysN/CysC
VINLTGRDQPYEVPEDPALVLRTAELTAEDAADRVLELVLRA